MLALFAAIPIGRRVDIQGERTFFMAGLALIVLAVILQLLAANMIVLAAGQAFIGLGQMALAISMQTLVAHGRTPASADDRFAQLAIAASIGLLSGPAIAGAAIGDSEIVRGQSGGLTLAYSLAVGLAVLALSISYVYVKSSSTTVNQSSKAGRSTVRIIIKQPAVMAALVASAAVLTTVDLLVTYLPLLGEERGIAPALVGILLSVRAGSELLARAALPLVSRRFGRIRVLFVTLIIAAVGMASLALPLAIGALFGAMCVIGFGLGLAAPMTASWIVSSGPSSELGATLAIRMASNRLGQLFVPASLGALSLALGSYVIFVAGAIGLLSSSLWVERFSAR